MIVDWPYTPDRKVFLLPLPKEKWVRLIVAKWYFALLTGAPQKQYFFLSAVTMRGKRKGSRDLTVRSAWGTRPLLCFKIAIGLDVR